MNLFYLLLLSLLAHLILGQHQEDCLELCTDDYNECLMTTMDIESCSKAATRCTDACDITSALL